MLGACTAVPATHASAPAHASAKPPAKAEPGTRSATASAATANEPRKQTERNDLDLAARVAPNATARQIAYLRQAKALYQEFIDRAKDRPDMHQAVLRSRERIEDIDKTIQFLQGTDGAASSQP